jgi:ubiquinone/menaquinone biosynthesis C-methylase UbiE
MEEKKVEFEIKFINPHAIIEELEIIPGMAIAVFGCGTGYFVFPLAEKVKQTGRIYALDILTEKLETIESQAKMLGLSNIIAKRVNLETANGSKLEENSLDWIFLVNMLFQNKNKELIVREATHVLKPGGKILIVEWNEKDASFGPNRTLRISRNEISELAQNNSLAMLKEIKISDFHFGLIFEK